MNDDDKKQFIDEFTKAEGSKKLDMWDYAIEQQVIWDKIITQLTLIAREQGVDKKLEKMAEEESKNMD